MTLIIMVYAANVGECIIPSIAREVAHKNLLYYVQKISRCSLFTSRPFLEKKVSS